MSTVQTIRLKRMLLECSITKVDFCQRIGWGTAKLYGALKGQFPKKMKKFAADVTQAVNDSTRMTAWLKHNGYSIEDLFKPETEAVKKWAKPVGHNLYAPSIVPGDPAAIDTHKEAEMITPRALKHFKLFRSPFMNDITDLKDIFFSQDHYFIKEMMLDTARHSGFTAVSGEVGSGKSVIRKAVFHELRSEEIKVIYPAIIDSSKINASSLVDAIIMDISEEKPKRVLEQKSRQALKLLRNRAMSGMKQVLIIEEAHMLNLAALKALKRIYELEDGFRRLVGIILIGQPELKYLLDETLDQGIREVARRVTHAEINGLGKDIGRYLAHKFARIKRKTEDVFADDAFDAIDRRLRDKVGRKDVSKAYPLTVNNLTANAMNLSAEIGESKVTADIILEL